MNQDVADTSTHPVPCACSVCFERQLRETHNALADEGDCWICQFYEAEPEPRKSYTQLFDMGCSLHFINGHCPGEQLCVFK